MNAKILRKERREKISGIILCVLCVFSLCSLRLYGLNTYFPNCCFTIFAMYFPRISNSIFTTVPFFIWWKLVTS